jgi:hypothetical protein
MPAGVEVPGTPAGLDDDERRALAPNILRLGEGSKSPGLTLGLVGHKSAVLERARVIRRPAQ